MERENFIKELSMKQQLQEFYKLLNNKNYDEIYNLYGKHAFLLFAPLSYKKDDIKNLMEKRQYSAIYNKYGKLEIFFIKDLRSKIKNDIKSLQNNGEYNSIYELYGEKEYQKNIEKYKEKDIINETNSKEKLVLYKTKKHIAKGLKRVLAVASLIPATPIMLLGGINIYNQNVAYNNSKIYAEELMEYNNSIEEYADSVKELELDDLQVIAKVMRDQWQNSAGYGASDYNIFGLWRLDTTAEDPKVICKSLADDFNARMNAINPEYNARLLVVDLDSSAFDKNSFAKINRTASPNPKKDLAIEKEFSLSLSFDNELKNDNGDDVLFRVDEISNGDKYLNSSKLLQLRLSDENLNFGNHVVSMIDIPGENLTLIVDSTNVCIGVLDDGKIKMLSTLDENCIEFEPLGEIVYNPISDTMNYFDKSVKSHFNKYSIEQLKEMYGTKALNNALYYVKNVERHKNK